MELQLALSLQCTQPLTKSFDLNINLSEYEREIIRDPMITINNGNNWLKFDLKKKRSFKDAFDYGGGLSTTTKTLFPLLSLNGAADGDDDDDGNGRNKRANNIIHKDEEEDEEYYEVGWPPLKCLWRKMMVPKLVDHQHDDDNDRTVEDRRSRKSIYVKVNMEGVVIGRKVDLRRFRSFHSLTNTLNTMFSIFVHYMGTDNNIEKDNYVLFYRDHGGDLLHTRDVPWETFIQTVKRLEILKKVPVDENTCICRNVK